MSQTMNKLLIKTARLWDAQKYSVGKGVSTNTDNSSKKSLTLTLEDLKGVEADYSKGKYNLYFSNYVSSKS